MDLANRTLTNLGQTRSARTADHLLQTPDTFVRAALPGMVRACAIVHVNPALGARFTQYTAEIESAGRLGETDAQRFVYVLQGQIEAGGDTIEEGGYCFVPQGETREIESATGARIAVIEKRYQALRGVNAPCFFSGREDQCPPEALGGDEALQVRALMPGGLEYDFAVNTMTYQPGAALSVVEVHVMEHGLLMLEGGGIYRLGNSWYPVTAGDFIWMAAYCPQWFGALGKTPAKYLIYKDWNRHPL